jgi:hypothetical protein
MKHIRIETEKERKTIIKKIAKMCTSTMSMYAEQEATKVVDNVLRGLNIDMTGKFTLNISTELTGAHIVKMLLEMRKKTKNKK